MKEIQDFTDKQEFIEFLDSHPKKGDAYPDLQYDIPQRVHPDDYFRLNTCTISFDGYNKFRLGMHPETNELFLADMNDGGHATLFGIIKIHREDIFTRQSWMKEWYDNDGRGSYKFCP